MLVSTSIILSLDSVRVALSDPQFNMTPIYLLLALMFSLSVSCLLPLKMPTLILKNPNVSALLQSFFEVNW